MWGVNWWHNQVLHQGFCPLVNSLSPMHTLLKFQFSCCLMMPGLGMDIWRRTRHLYSHQELFKIITTITVVVNTILTIITLTPLSPLSYHRSSFFFLCFFFFWGGGDFMGCANRIKKRNFLETMCWWIHGRVRVLIVSMQKKATFILYVKYDTIKCHSSKHMMRGCLMAWVILY